MTPLIKKFQYGNHTVTLETGRIARQATGAVLCSIDNTSVLCTVVGARAQNKPCYDLLLNPSYETKQIQAYNNK